ncbi:MAG: helix-turn-helix transcriptional regulator [Cyanothece sp. SIO1E1]|nr:helix-turn-helix transcriptional regulator [Cyanothece sp. SIO1E1]
MREYTIPNHLIQEDSPPPIGLIDYRAEGNPVRNRILYTQNVISFMIQGSKEIHMQESPLSFDQSHFAIITSSRCLMTEISANGQYRSLLFFFDDEVLRSIWLKHMDAFQEVETKAEALSLPYDPYLLQFRSSLELLCQTNSPSLALLRAKLEEFLLYVLQRRPQQLIALLNNSKSKTEVNFRNVVENNLFSNLSVEELAFLCNMSISTFKRHFHKFYETSPSRFIHEQRMKMAGQLLQKKKLPSEIYNLVGYDSYSNFARAFKQYYQVSPRQYINMND